MLTTLQYRIKNYIKSVKKLWRWIPIIWNDRDWDSYYTLEILKKKLEDVEKYIREDGIHLYNHIDAEKIRTALRLLERVQKEHYLDEYMSSTDVWESKEMDKALAKHEKAQRIFYKFLQYNLPKWWD